VKPTPLGQETQKSNPALRGWGRASGYYHGQIKIYIVEKPQTRCNGPKLGCHAILVVVVVVAAAAAVVAAVVIIAAVTQ